MFEYLSSCLSFCSSVRWQKNGSFGFLSVGLSVGKNQMCHLCGWLITLSDNVPALCEVASFVTEYFLLLLNFLRKINVNLPHNSQSRKTCVGRSYLYVLLFLARLKYLKVNCAFSISVFPPFEYGKMWSTSESSIVKILCPEIAQTGFLSKSSFLI